MYPSPSTASPVQGNFTLMTDDLPGAIRKFGKQGKISSPTSATCAAPPINSRDFHDEGKTNMLACMQAYKESASTVCCARPRTTMEGDSNDNPSYSSIGRLFAIGYIKGLRQAVYAQPHG